MPHSLSTSDERTGRKNIHPKALILVVGPEGGFSERENQILERTNSIKLKVSNQILRIETAAISLIAAVNQRIWMNN